MSTESVLSFISDLSVFLPVVVGLYSIKNLSKNSTIVLCIVAFAIIPQLINMIDPKDPTIKYFSYNVYTPIEFVCFYFFFIQYINNKLEKIFSNLFFLFYLLISIFFIINKNFTLRFFDEWVCLNNLSYTMWILFIFYKQYSLSEFSIIDLNTSSFWIMIGLLFYASCSTLYFSVYHYAQQQSFSSLKIIHHIVNVNMYICFAIGIYKDRLQFHK